MSAFHPKRALVFRLKNRGLDRALRSVRLVVRCLPLGGLVFKVHSHRQKLFSRTFGDTGLCVPSAKSGQVSASCHIVHMVRAD